MCEKNSSLSQDGRMEIRIDKLSEVPVRQQLAEQIIYLIATEKLKPGEVLPSVREFARRLKIHRNTVSQAYRDLKRRSWLVARRGSRVVVRAPDTQRGATDSSDLDDLINATIRIAREHGYTLQMLRERVMDRLLAQAPDRILVVEEEPGLRSLLKEEIRALHYWAVEGCALRDLATDPGLAIGALPVAASYAIERLDATVPKRMPPMPLAFGTAAEQLALIKSLRHASMLAVVSVSEVFLKTARSLLAPAIGERHTLCEFRFPLDNPGALMAFDVVFADSIASPQIKHTKLVQYRLIQPASLNYLVSAMKSYAIVRSA